MDYIVCMYIKGVGWFSKQNYVVLKDKPSIKKFPKKLNQYFDKKKSSFLDYLWMWWIDVVYYWTNSCQKVIETRLVVDVNGKIIIIIN